MDLLDNVDLVASRKGEETEPRGHTMPIYGPEYSWWTEACERQLKVVGVNRKELAALLGVHPSLITRCINRETPTYELIIGISDHLKVAYPVLFPESEAEALALATEKRAHKRDVEVGKIKTGVPEIAKEDQAPGVLSEHAVRSRKEVPKKKPRARRQPSPA